MVKKGQPQPRTVKTRSAVRSRIAGQDALAAIIEAIPSAILVVDDRGLIKLVNTQLESLFGYDRTELLEQPIEILVPERYRELHPSHRNGFFTNPAARRLGVGRKLYGRRKNGTDVPIEIGLSPIRTSGEFFVVASIIDISERVRSERISRETNERLKTVLENLTEGLVISDMDGQMIHWNRAAVQMHGFSSLAECPVKLPELEKIFELSSLDGAKLRYDQWPLPRLMAGHRLNDFEVRIRRLDSDWSRVFSYGGAIIKEPGAGPLAFVTVNDITDRKKAEEALRHSQAQFSSIVESAMDAIVAVDEAQNVQIFNGAAEKMFGCPARNAIGKPLDAFLPPGLREIHRRHITNFGKTNVTTRTMAALGDVAGVNAEGKQFPIEASISQVQIGGKKLFTAILRDITERRRAEEALMASEVRYRRLFESAKDGVLILDADAGEIVDVNPFLVEMLGYSREELVGKELWEIGVFKDIIASRAAFVELKEHGYIRYEDLPLETRDGLVKQVEFVSNSYLADGIRVIQCNIRDISERRQAEKELRRSNQRLEQALAELQAKRDELTGMTQQLWQASKLATMGELAASVAHELNNPLATVALRAELLMQALQDHEAPHQSAEIILNEVERMARLVENLLQFSRRSHRQISTLDIRDEIENSIEFVEYHLRNHKVEVLREFADAIATIQADRQQLRQLFLNLLTNASDAMPAGGKVTVRAALINVDGRPAVGVDFADTGEGIAAENISKIWEPFFTTKPEGKGTGLGLAICRRIVEEHGGTIDIESRRGNGTTVRMVFPATVNERRNS